MMHGQKNIKLQNRWLIYTLN